MFQLDHVVSKVYQRICPIFSDLIKSYEFLKVASGLFAFKISDAVCTWSDTRSGLYSNHAPCRGTSAFASFGLV